MNQATDTGAQRPALPTKTRPPGQAWEEVERFRGTHHPALAEALSKRAHQGGLNPRVIVVHAPSGDGKSRVVREMYRRLKSERHDTYWPKLPGWGPEGDVDTERKCVGPTPKSFMWQKDTLPTFAWWHLNCEDLAQGTSADISDALTQQLKAHTIPLTIAVHRGVGGYLRRIDAIGEVLARHVHDLMRDEARGLAATTLAGIIPVPGLAQILGLGEVGAKAWYKHLKTMRALHSDEDTGAIVRADTYGRIETLAQAIHAQSSPAVPAVVAIEDLHAMSSEVAHFLDTLISLGTNDPLHQVLIVATAWPEGHREIHQQWLARHEAVTETIELQHLDPEDLAAIVLAAAPHTDDDVAHHVARALPSPYLIKQWLALRMVRQTIKDEGDRLTQDSVAKLLPRGADSAAVLQRARWRELAPDVQVALMYAVASEGAHDGTAEYVPTVVAALDERRTQDMLTGLDRAVAPAGWARRVNDMHLTTDAATRCIAWAASSDLPLSVHAADQLPTRALQRSEEFLRLYVDNLPLEDPTASPGSLHAASTILTSRAGATAAGRHLAAYVIAVGHYRSEQPQEALAALLQMPQQLHEHIGARAAAAVAVLASACAAASHAPAPAHGQQLEAVAALVEAALSSADRQPTNVGREEIRALRTAAQEIRLRLAARRPDVTDDMHRHVAALLAAGPETDPAKTVAALVDLALLINDTQGRKPAARLARQALETAQQRLGIGAPVTLQTATLYLALAGLDGNAKEHTALLAELVDIAHATYGEDDHRTLDLRRQELRWQVKANPTPDLAQRFAPLVEACKRTVGPYAAMTITARIQQAQAWSRCEGKAEAAHEMIKELIEDLTSVLGADHPMTAQARWYEKNQILPKVLLRNADTSEFVRATPEGNSWSRSVSWTPQAVALLRTYY